MKFCLLSIVAEIDPIEFILMFIIHRKKKDGGCTFYQNTLRTKLSSLGIWKDMV